MFSKAHGLTTSKYLREGRGFYRMDPPHHGGSGALLTCRAVFFPHELQRLLHQSSKTLSVIHKFEYCLRYKTGSVRHGSSSTIIDVTFSKSHLERISSQEQYLNRHKTKSNLNLSSRAAAICIMMQTEVVLSKINMMKKWNAEE